MPSQSGSLSKEDILKIAKGALIAVVGSIITYAATEVVPQLHEVGTIGTLAIATVVMVGVNAGRKWIADQK